MNHPSLTLEKLLSDADFIDYCLGDDSAGAHKWKNFVPASPEEEKRIDEAKAYVLLLTGQIPEHIVEARLSRFKQLFKEAKNRTQPKEKRTYKLNNFNRWLMTGVAASLFLIAGYFFHLHIDTPKSWAFAKIAGKKIETPADTRKTILLSDGTEAILFPGSKLIVSNDFNETDRKVAVYGQVYFKIFHQKEKPFIAYSKHTTTTAVGTAFYVRDFLKGKTSSVVLINGKVKVQEPASNGVQFLEPGTALEVDQTTLKSTKKVLNKEAFQALTAHKLYFNNSDIHTIVDKLELYYGVEINIKSCNCSFKGITGDYSNHSLTTILNTISYINNVTWKLENQQVEFIPKTNPK